jgi:hypothetical protein
MHIMSLQRTSSLFAGAILTLGLIPGSAGAAVITYTGDGSFDDGGTTRALKAEATFTTGAGFITVVLSNTLDADAFRTSAQALSDITFTLSNNAGNLGAQTASGQFGDISGNPNPGVVTYVSTDAETGDSTPVRWFANGDVSGDTVTLEAIGGGQPSQMIAPDLADGGQYAIANNGVQQFNSYVIGSATFTIALDGVTADTTVTGVTFSFGTGPDHFVTGDPGVVPEPSALALAGIGGLGMLVAARRRRA